MNIRDVLKRVESTLKRTGVCGWRILPPAKAGGYRGPAEAGGGLSVCYRVIECVARCARGESGDESPQSKGVMAVSGCGGSEGVNAVTGKGVRW